MVAVLKYVFTLFGTLPGISDCSWLLQPAEHCGSDAMGLLRLGHKRPCSLWLTCWNICFWNLYTQRDWIILRQPCCEKAQATGRAVFGLTIPVNSSLQDIFHSRRQANEWRNHLGNGPTTITISASWHHAVETSFSYPVLGEFLMQNS